MPEYCYTMFVRWCVPFLPHTSLFPAIWCKLILSLTVQMLVAPPPLYRCYRLFLARSNLPVLECNQCSGLHLVVNPRYLHRWLVIADLGSDAPKSVHDLDRWAWFFFKWQWKATKYKFSILNQLQIGLLHLLWKVKGMVLTWAWNCMSVSCPIIFEPQKMKDCIKLAGIPETVDLFLLNFCY